MNNDLNKIDEFLTRAVAEILPTKDGLREKLISGDKLRIYNGIDPTSVSIHLGNAIVLRKLQDLVEMGHEVVFLIGSFTAQIGDPSGKDAVRPMLSREQVEKNFQDYQQQAGKILDFDRVKLEHNSNWHESMTLDKFMEILSKVTHQQLIERDLFQKRLAENKDLYMHELMYPILQGWDSVMLDVDLEMGGTDQTFNMLMGRRLQKIYDKREKFVLSVPLIPGTDGQKMSKSIGNTINLKDSATDIYGKLMSLPDAVLAQYLECCTTISWEEVKQIIQQLTEGAVHPMEIKKKIAQNVVEQFHGHAPAQEAAANFEKTVQRKELPDELLPAKIIGTPSLVELIASLSLTSSKSEAKRLIEQGGVRIEGVVHNDPQEAISSDYIGKNLQVGKRGFFRMET